MVDPRASVWQRLVGLVAERRTRRPRVSIKQRFELFQNVNAANDAFLTGLTHLMEHGGSTQPLGRGTVQAGLGALCRACETMVSSLISMAPGRYEPLDQQFRRIEQEALEIGAQALAGDSMPLVVWPDDPLALRPGVVGGKAANLAALAACTDAVVPPFFVVTARAYQLMIEAAQVQPLVDEWRGSGDRPAADDLSSVCETNVQRIQSTPVPEAIAQAIAAAHDRLVASADLGFGLAVRSSATLEDSDFSFAGQFETRLGVRSADLCAAYRAVVASKYRLAALRYASLSGARADDIAMPVLCMAMLQPVTSGVAYSRDPDGRDSVIVTAVRGLAEAAVAGTVTPDRHTVGRLAPHPVLEQTIAPKTRALRCSADGVVEQSIAAAQAAQPAAAPEIVVRVARLAIALEQHFGRPQDVEWALDESGALYTVQSRPLDVDSAATASADVTSLVEGRRVLLAGGMRACGGVATGRIVRLLDLDQLDAVAPGAVVVAATTSPRLAALVGRVAAIVTDTGSPTGHMATVAREFRLPTLVGVPGATAGLVDGTAVTVDAWSARIYEGEVRELLGSGAPRRSASVAPSAARTELQRLLEKVAPLHLGDPLAADFTIASCSTLHDVARFVHQRAMAEMFEVETLAPAERRETHQLRWSVPMEVRVLDLGGGVAPDSGRVVDIQQVASVPFLALLEGMTDPRLRWSGPVGFDLKGFMSVAVRSAVDDQRYGEPSFAICSREYLHFASRLAYHFATVDAMGSPRENQNYARFLFFGGAAVAARRECRAHFLALVLKLYGFEVTRVGDRVEAILGKRSADEIEEALVLLGRLMVSARHLDMIIDSPEKGEAYAAAFLSGDFGFEFVRKELR